MTIHKLQIENFRNLKKVNLEPSPHINIFHGTNGSGKTNLLEALFFLTHGRSYKTSRNASMVNLNADSTTVFATIGNSNLPVGIQKNNSGNTQIRISGESVNSVSQLASIVPVQMIHAEAFQILEGSPRYRRQFLDWGVFHVEHQFINTWRNSQKALKNRNTLLRSGRMSENELASWNAEFIENSNLVDQSRVRYLQGFESDFISLNKSLTGIDDLSLNYFRGWDRTKTLSEVLNDSIVRDKKSGFTHSGPQRADLKVRLGKLNAADILSRGQQKLVVSALKLAQGKFLHKSKLEKRCVYLLDDLPAELDKAHLTKVCKALESIDAQVFISCIDPDVFQGCWENTNQVKMFHVEQGVLS